MSSIKKQLSGKHSKLSSKKNSIHKNHPADLDNYYENGKFYTIDINLITPDPNQPRKHFDLNALNELSLSIKQQGILQPVIVRKSDNNIHLVAGERRFRAAKMANLTQIPAILTTGRPDEISLIENIQRENLMPIEEAEALNRLMVKHNYTQKQLADVIGKNRTTITATLSLNKLPEEIKTKCTAANNLPKRLLIEIARQDTPDAMISLFKQTERENLKSDAVRNIAKKKENFSTIFISNKIIGLLKLLKKANLDSIKKEERRKIIDELTTLKNFIEKEIRN